MDALILAKAYLELSAHRPERVHVFDLDNTFVNGQLLFHLIYSVASTLPDRDKFRLRLDRYVANLHVHQGAIPFMNSLAIALADENFFVGLEEGRVAALARGLAARIKNETNAFPLAVLEAIKHYSGESGRHACSMALSGAPHVVAEPFCGQHGFCAVFGSAYWARHDNGGVRRYTAERDLDSGLRKGPLVKVTGEFLGVDWAESVGMGDTLADIDVFKQVGYPVAINPDGKLLAEMRGIEGAGVVFESPKIGVNLLRVSRGRLIEAELHEILPRSLARYCPPVDRMRYAYENDETLDLDIERSILLGVVKGASKT